MREFIIYLLWNFYRHTLYIKNKINYNYILNKLPGKSYYIFLVFERKSTIFPTKTYTYSNYFPLRFFPANTHTHNDRARSIFPFEAAIFRANLLLHVPVSRRPSIQSKALARIEKRPLLIRTPVPSDLYILILCACV